MTTKDMHYDIKFKLNKIDSQQYRNLRIPEIDWALNEALSIFIKNKVYPKDGSSTGFESNQMVIEDLRTIVIDNLEIIPVLIPNTNTYIVTLPNNYFYYVNSTTIAENTCGIREIRNTEVQHDDLFEESSFDKSSYEWRRVNITFNEKGIKIYANESFTIPKFKLSYIKKHAYIHDAESFLPAGQYNLPSGITLVGTQNCELPEHTHREIVDLAVLILSGNLDMPNYQIKRDKINFN